MSRNTWHRFLNLLQALGRSGVGREAKWLFVGLMVFMLGINGLNVMNSYVGRDFMTSIENRDMGRFTYYAALYLGVFGLSTVVAVIYRFFEERLGLLTRKWLTSWAIERYMEGHVYFKINAYGDLRNPDQRISEDIRALTASTLTFVLMVLNATVTVIAFSGVMWSISPWLLLVTILYAAAGSLFTFLLGRPLIRLNYDQSDKEANFRARLLHIRENAESIALVRQEDRLRERLHDRLDKLALNFRRIIDVNRNLGFFTTGYNYAIQIIPALLVAPLFISGHVEFGVISQSAMAFGHLIGAFSLIVTQFQSISAYTAVIARVGGLADAMRKAGEPATPAIAHCTECGQIAFDHLTLKSPRSGRILVKDLTLTVPQRSPLLIRVTDDTARTALFRAAAGLWERGEGRISQPEPDDILFLPERPYVPPGTLREVLLPSAGASTGVGAGKGAGMRTRAERSPGDNPPQGAPSRRPATTSRRFSDEGILTTLRALKLVAAVERAGGLDEEQNWGELLTLGEQQALAFARVLLAEPAFVVLDHPTRALSECEVNELLMLLRMRGITYVTLGDEDDDAVLYEQLLTIERNGRWTLTPLPGRVDPAANGVTDAVSLD